MRYGCWAAGLVLLLFFGTGPSPAQAQELSCRVQIDRSQLGGSEYAFLDDLERRIREYLNNRTWTDDEFRPQERITCSMQIVIQEALSLTEFRARLVVTSRRPIYNTSQSTIVTRINDAQWEFEYGRGRSLSYDIDLYDPLTSVLDFYAYILLGYDYDTFDELGGTPYFERARRIANQAEGEGDPGWSAIGAERSRARLAADLLDQRHQALRRAYYRYHRKGLDRYVSETEAARKQILAALETVQEFNASVTRSYPLDLFFSTKYQELTAAFEGSDRRRQAYNLLSQMDPAHSSEYNQLIE